MKKMVKLAPMWLLDRIENRILDDYEKTRKFLQGSDPELLEAISQKKAMAAFRRAARKVPAYKKFLKEHNLKPGQVKNMEFFDGIVPITDKDRYVRKYSIESRCTGGKFPKAGNIDESSGSTGVPTNWIRSVKEEEKLTKTIRFLFRHIIGEGDYMVISCWSSGAWATGVKFCELVERFALVKNVGTDIDKTIKTLQAFGPDKRYLIAGYPQYLKELVERKELDWKKYRIDMLTGGDGTAIGWEEQIRNELGRKEAKIVSAYGSSDIDIGVANETPLTQKIRKRCAEDEELCKALFGDPRRVPMLFQYNPMMHYIQNKVVKGKREFVITALDRKIASPKIKYAMHDEGGVLRYKEMMQKLERHGVKVEEDMRLPFLYVYGRSDGTISLDGANVFPEQVERSILENKELADRMNNYMIEKAYDKRHKARFIVHIELMKGTRAGPELKRSFGRAILKGLLRLNADYKESYENNKSLKPNVELYKMDSGPFAVDNLRLKHKFILQHE